MLVGAVKALPYNELKRSFQFGKVLCVVIAILHRGVLVMRHAEREEVDMMVLHNNTCLCVHVFVWVRSSLSVTAFLALHTHSPHQFHMHTHTFVPQDMGSVLAENITAKVWYPLTLTTWLPDMGITGWRLPDVGCGNNPVDSCWIRA